MFRHNPGQRARRVRAVAEIYWLRSGYCVLSSFKSASLLRRILKWTNLRKAMEGKAPGVPTSPHTFNHPLPAVLCPNLDLSKTLLLNIWFWAVSLRCIRTAMRENEIWLGSILRLPSSQFSSPRVRLYLVDLVAQPQGNYVSYSYHLTAGNMSRWNWNLSNACDTIVPHGLKATRIIGF